MPEKDIRTVLKKLLFPPIGVLILLAIVSTAALVVVFLNDLDTELIAYMIYVFSFYSLVVICIACYFKIPGYYKKIRQEINDKWGHRFVLDPARKTHLSLYRSLIVNLFYIAVHMLYVVLYHTAWFIIFAVYYSILAMVRFLLLRYADRNKIGENRISELKRSRMCAYILLLINFVLSGAVLMILYQHRGFEYHGILIYVMAMYTFYSTTISGINLVKYRRYNSPVLLTARVINLAQALVSFLALETAMFSQFAAENSLESQKIIIIATGAAVSMFIVTISIYMIVRSNSELKKERLRL